MDLDIRNRVALVTGAGGHLGRHVVRRLHDGGAHVHAATYDRAEAVELSEFLRAPDKVRVHPAGDLGAEEQASHLIDEVRDAAGAGPEILVNLAGGFAMDPVEETDAETWERMWRMNATTAFLCSRAVLPEMKKRGRGRIVNVSALPALEGGHADLSAYGAAKAAVLNLTGTLAREGVGHGITANAVLPSIIDTPANRAAMPGAETTSWLDPEEIADVIVFLVSGRARIVNAAAIPLTRGE